MHPKYTKCTHQIKKAWIQQRDQYHIIYNIKFLANNA